MRHLMLLLLHRLLLIGCIHYTSSFRTISTTRSRSTLPSRITAKANGDAEAEAEDANNTTSSNTICILGGSGRIGSAVAIHLLQRDPTCTIILVGRRQSQIDAAVEEVLAETTTTRQTDQKDKRVTGHRLESVWDATSDGYQALVDTADCIIHTAGPYLEEQPVPLQMALRPTNAERMWTCRTHYPIWNNLCCYPTWPNTTISLHSWRRVPFRV